MWYVCRSAGSLGLCQSQSGGGRQKGCGHVLPCGGWDGPCEWLEVIGQRRPSEECATDTVQGVASVWSKMPEGEVCVSQLLSCSVILGTGAHMRSSGPHPIWLFLVFKTALLQSFIYCRVHWFTVQWSLAYVGLCNMM